MRSVLVAFCRKQTFPLSHRELCFSQLAGPRVTEGCQVAKLRKLRSLPAPPHIPHLCYSWLFFRIPENTHSSSCRTSYFTQTRIYVPSVHGVAMMPLCPLPPPLSKQRLCPSNTERWFRQFLHRRFWRCAFQLVLRCAMCAS